MLAQEALLLSASANDGQLSLRIDTELWGPLSRPDAVQVLTMNNAQLEAGEHPSSWVGKPIYVNSYQDDHAFIVELYIDHAVDYVEVKCSSVTSESTSYSASDLQLKFDAVVAAASGYADSYAAVDKALSQLTETLSKRIDHEIDNQQRKAQHFARSEPSRAAENSRHARFLQSLKEALEAVTAG